MHVDTNFVVSKGRERTLDDPEVLQTESFDLGDEICLLLRRTHRGLHAAAENRLTLRRGSRGKKPPSGDATVYEGEMGAAQFRTFSSCGTVHFAGPACSRPGACSRF